MKSKYFSILILLPFLSVVSCRKYVEIKTQGALVPKQVNNYRYLLNNTEDFSRGPAIGDISSDDVELIDGTYQQSSLTDAGYTYWSSAYTWQKILYPVNTFNQDDQNWNNMYNTIVYSNVVISEVPTSEGEEGVKNELIAEALVHRADAYLMLVNTYAKPYNAQTAASDPGVPLVLTQTVDQLLVREPVQRIYDQVIADLNNALPFLVQQTITTLPSKVSAYAELARCYLYMNQYEKAATYADSALSIKNELVDLGAITELNNSTYPRRIENPEILLSKVASSGVVYAPASLRLSDDLLAVLGTNDQRYTLFTAPADVVDFFYGDAGGRYFFLDNFMNEPRNLGPTVPEMMLIKAEFFARSGDAVNAITMVNSLREKRFKPEDFTPLVAASADEALVSVMNERRREFFCRMLRWWDMRRIKNEPLFQKTYTRVFNGNTFTLDPQSDRYVFAIPESQILLNKEITQNP